MQAVAVTSRLILTGSLAGLAACAGAGAGGSTGDGAKAAGPVYLGAETHALGPDLVEVKLQLKGVSGADEIDDYAACNAAAYAMKNKAGFVRHVRTLTDKEGGVWRADAVYSVSAALPKGRQTIDAEVTLADCTDRGIPTDRENGLR